MLVLNIGRMRFYILFFLNIGLDKRPTLVCTEGLNFVQVKIGEAKEVSVNEKLSEATKFEVELSSGDKVRLPLSKDVLVMTINLLKRQGC